MRILLAEDDRNSRMMLLELLDKWGCDVQIAENGAEAWNVLQSSGSPRLVLLDWMMPDLSGLDICRKLRARREERYVYAILLTGRTAQTDIAEGLRSGADDYLTKPCDPAELRARLGIGERILKMQDDLIQAREIVRFKSTHDLLTGAWSRDVLLDRLERELDRAQGEFHPLGVMLIAFDNFRQVNNAKGIYAGDEALQGAVRRILTSVRGFDTVGRLASEEFMILLPGCDTVATRDKAEEIRKTVCSAPVPTSAGPVNLTLSVGALSTWRNELPTAAAVLRSANAAAQCAKKNGRNRVELCSLSVASRAVTDDIEMSRVE
ncbi:MAG TPA: diguanylate cyclase [Candidatus Acidoferrales bacterium]|nr:diguanylate cyclase [Candidatus Acidoferrales bacterium]